MKVHITEMDLYQGPTILRKFSPQKEIYYNVVHTCLKDSNCIGFMTWGIADRYSFLRKKTHRMPASPCLTTATEKAGLLWRAASFERGTMS